MNSSQQNNPDKNNQKKEFFQLTGHQLSVNIHRYEKVLNKPQVTIFNKKQLDEIEEEKKEKLLLKRLNATDCIQKKNIKKLSMFITRLYL